MSGTEHGIRRREPALWNLRFRWLAAIAFALVPLVFTAAASAITQVAHTDGTASALIIAGGAGVSAVIGLAVMHVSPSDLRQYGFRRPHAARAVWGFLPMVIALGVAIATQGAVVRGSAMAASGALAVSVAVNEEVWFRGIILSVLREGGVRVAVLGSSLIFGVLHLSNLAGGEEPAAAVLQLVFAVLFGIVAAEMTVLTSSLWPAIASHATWDFVNYVGGNATTGIALTGIGIACATILVYTLGMWRRTTQVRP